MTLVGALLLSSALAAPAFAQIEEVVVTAQKKSEDIQSVPIAVSAFSGQDLAAHQIEGFKDLEFSVPSVHFTHGNFGPSNFTIRGIGSAAVTTSGDEGVSVNINQVYLNSPPLTSATYYDVQQIQVLRGPQSTLWGRNATGGAIDIETNKPALDAFGANIEGTYGNYNDQEVRFMLNLPIVTDQLGVRVAGFWENRDGTVRNIYDSLHPGSGIAKNIDSRNDYSIRGSVRWEPTSRTTIDAIIQASHEGDTRVRGQVQECQRDPSGVLGCLPDSLKFEPTNGNSTLAVLLASNLVLGQALSLFDVSPVGGAAYSSPGVGASTVVPHSLTAVNTGFTPVSRGKDIFASIHWKQQLWDWLSADLTLGMDNNSGLSQQAYSTPDETLNSAATCTQLFLVSGGADATCTPIPGQTRLVAAQEIFSSVAPINYAHYYAGHLGTLPISQIAGPFNTGIAGGPIRDYSGNLEGYDQIDGRDNEWSAELRFQSNFEGPFNFLVAAYHNSDRNDAHYYVVANTLDYNAVTLGALSAADGLVLYPSQYDNNNQKYELSSDALFGELYYDAIPDVLKFTAGLRYTHDTKSFQSGQVLFNFAAPIGTSSFTWLNLPQSFNAVGGCGAGTVGNPLGVPCLSNQSTTFNSWTGRAVVDWTPTLDFTDSTHIYASYSRGYRDGGFNPPPLNPGAFPLTFAPETLDAIEVGAKNNLLGNTLQANLDAWYYNYKGFQVSEIVDRTSVNQNINSKLWGVEGQFFWAPTEHLQFNANFGYTHSAIANQLDVDPRNPLGNRYTDSTLVKDAGNGSFCVVNNDSGFPTAEAAGFVAPPPVPTVINGHTVASGFGNCATLAAALNVAGSHYQVVQGNPVNLKGNQMPNTAPWTFDVGAQYTFDLDGGYTLVPRADFYWSDSFWGRIFQDGADKFKSYSTTSAQIQLNAPDSAWYVRGWVQNAFDQHNATGEYLTDATSGLFTNVFVNSPRTYGVTVGANF